MEGGGELRRGVPEDAKLTGKVQLGEMDDLKPIALAWQCPVSSKKCKKSLGE
jgi:hypothetical protein